MCPGNAYIFLILHNSNSINSFTGVDGEVTDLNLLAALVYECNCRNVQTKGGKKNGTFHFTGISKYFIIFLIYINTNLII